MLVRLKLLLFVLFLQLLVIEPYHHYIKFYFFHYNVKYYKPIFNEITNEIDIENKIQYHDENLILEIILN